MTSFTRTQPVERKGWVDFLNVGDVVVPPHSIIQITDSGFIAPDIEHLEGRLPTTNVGPHNFAITDKQAVPRGGTGYCTRDNFGVVRISQTSTSPNIDGDLGPRAGQFEAEVGVQGLTYHGLVNATRLLAFVSFKSTAESEFNLVALTPESGIPPHETVGNEQIPGAALAAIFAVVDGRLVSQFEDQVVFNTSTTAITGEKFIPIHKTRGGVYVAPPPAVGGGGVKARTPTSGIPGRTDLVMGSAVCDIYAIVSGQLAMVGTELIYNLAEERVGVQGQNTWIQAKRDENDGTLVCDWEECP